MKVVAYSRGFVGVALAFLAVTGCSGSTPLQDQDLSARQTPLPVMRWDHRPEAQEWTQATLDAVNGHGVALIQTVPRDIQAFCPAYPNATDQDRAAFWSGLMSALAKHESTWKPEASGGGGKWIGLTQIAPATARGYDCKAQNTAALKDGAANLSCAVRIAAFQVSRDDALVSSENGDWRGMARDWAPFTTTSKRQDMAAWTRVQPYCVK